MKRKWLKKSVIALMLATVLMSTVGCGVDDIGGSGKLDIDYVGEDGEVTEEEVTPESPAVMQQKSLRPIIIQKKRRAA